MREGAVATTRDVRNGRLAKMMESADSEVNQWRGMKDEAGSAMVRAREMILEIRMRVPIMKRMARRSRRGVGMKGTGRSIVQMVKGTLKESVVAAWAWKETHCAGSKVSRLSEYNKDIFKRYSSFDRGF